jgi:arylsulfatase A-like enzyme
MLAAPALCGLALLAGCTGGGRGPEPGVPAEPHPVIVIALNAVRADHLGCYGYERASSPNIDALAEESVRFEWAFSQAPDPAPSQASIVSGLYPRTHQMFDQTTRLPSEVVTMAEAFSAKGVPTAAFVDGGFMSEVFGLSQGFDTFDDSAGDGIAAIGPKAMAWLEEHSGESFFLLIHAYDAHAPYAPPGEYREMFSEGIEPPSEGFEPTPEQMKPPREDGGATARMLLPRDLAYAKALYDGEIRHVDHWVGELMTKLRSLGLDQRATVVLVSDHGQEFQEHGDLLHGQIHTTVTRVPMLIRLPGGQHAGAVDDYAETVDIMPTLLDLSGIPVPPPVQGQSLLPTVLREQGQGRPLAFTESTHFGGQLAVAMGGYRMVLNLDPERAELYDLSADPLERNNIASEHPKRLQVLNARLQDWRERVEGASYDPEKQEEMDQETLDQLKGLGYIQ